MSAPTVFVGGVLIVREGSRRLRWVGHGESWKLVGMWPDPDHDTVTSAHLVSGGPLLVVLDSEPAWVPVLREELAVPDPLLRQLGLPDACPSSRSSAGRAARDVPDDLLDVRVPFLDWLPSELREIGRRFAGHSADIVQRTPAALLPALLLSEPDDGARHIRFARFTQGHGGLSPDQLQRVARHAFPVRAPVGAPC